MKDYEHAGCLVFGIFVLAGIFAVFQAYECGKKEANELKAEAHKRGFATWVSDENGNTTFTWKELTP